MLPKAIQYQRCPCVSADMTAVSVLATDVYRHDGVFIRQAPACLRGWHLKASACGSTSTLDTHFLGRCPHMCVEFPHNLAALNQIFGDMLWLGLAVEHGRILH